MPMITIAEEEHRSLSDRDRDILLALLENPPGPNEALKQAALRYQQIKKDKVDGIFVEETVLPKPPHTLPGESGSCF